MTIGALAEPALLVAVLALSIQAGTSNLPRIVTATLAHPGWAASPERLLALVALVIVMFAEAGRIPVDNPSTHLELTMIHEAMVLEYAGPELALVTLGEAMRLGLLLSLAGEPLLPVGHRRHGERPAASRSGSPCSRPRRPRSRRRSRSLEVSTAKLRLFRVPEILSAAFVLAVLAVVTGLVMPMTGSGYSGPLGLAAGAVLACAVVDAVAPGPARGRLGPRRPGDRPRRRRRRCSPPTPATSAWASPPPSSLPPRASSSRRCSGGSCAATPAAGKPRRWSTCRRRSLAAAALIVVAYLASGKLTALAPGAAARLAPFGVATVLIGFFVLVDQAQGGLRRSSGCCWSTTGSRSSRSCSPPGCRCWWSSGRPSTSCSSSSSCGSSPRRCAPASAPSTSTSSGSCTTDAHLRHPRRARSPPGRSPPPCRGGAGSAGLTAAANGAVLVLGIVLAAEVTRASPGRRGRRRACAPTRSVRVHGRRHRRDRRPRLLAVGPLPERRDRRGEPARRRHAALYTVLVQAFVTLHARCAVLAANLGVMWVAVEATTIATTFLVGHRRTDGALEASWKYVVICSVGIALAFLGTVLVYFAAHARHGGHAGRGRSTGPR